MLQRNDWRCTSTSCLQDIWTSLQTVAAWVQLTYHSVTHRFGKCRMWKFSSCSPNTIVPLDILPGCQNEVKLHANADPQAGWVRDPGTTSTPLSCFLCFQSYPASLQVMVRAEGEQLVLLLEKNEWVVLWFMSVLLSILKIGHRDSGSWIIMTLITDKHMIPSMAR